MLLFLRCGCHRAMRSLCVLFLLSLLLAGCAGSGSPGARSGGEMAPRQRSVQAESLAQDVVIFALSLLETGYRFGGKNPEAGLDCSGMVSYVFDRAAGVKMAGSAADIARRGQRVPLAALQPGDLVFFNIRRQPHSHVGIYIGDGRFVHAPSTNGKVRTDNLFTGWFAERFEEARTYLD